MVAVITTWQGICLLALVLVGGYFGLAPLIFALALFAICFSWDVRRHQRLDAEMVPDQFDTIVFQGNQWFYIDEDDAGTLRNPLQGERVVHLKPDMAIIDVTRGTVTQPVPVRWEPDREEIKAYVNYFLLPSGDVRPTFVADLSKLLALAPTATAADWLNASYAAHYGIKFLSVGFPPEPTKQAPPPKDTRSKAELELDRLFAGVKTAAQARQKWLEMKKNPDFAEALADDHLGPKLQGKYQDIVTRIAEGDV